MARRTPRATSTTSTSSSDGFAGSSSCLPFTRPDGATLVPERAFAPAGTSERSATARTRPTWSAPSRSRRSSRSALLAIDVVATPRGVLVTSVSADVPAAKELKPDDVIVAVDGVPVRTPAQLRREIGRHKPGDELRLTLHRGDKVKDVTVRTIASPVDSSRAIIGILVDQDAKIELPVHVGIDLGRVGGPSAGLPFALEIARQLGRRTSPMAAGSQRRASSRSTAASCRLAASSRRRSEHAGPVWISSWCRPGRTPRERSTMPTGWTSSLLTVFNRRCGAWQRRK